jgi:putative spermidine/putrescine transport system substrate-binding protein
MRRAHKGGGLVALLLAVVTGAACGGGGGGSPASTQGTSTTSLVVVNTGGDWGACQRKSFFDPFTAKTGIKIVDGPFLTDGQIKAMVQTKQYNVDVVYPSANLAIPSAGKNVLESIDYNTVNKSELASGTYTTYGTSIDIFSWALGYRTDKFGGQTPKTWADFFDTKRFPGKRALPGDNDVPAVLYAALLADGVSPDHLLPLDVNRALKKLSTIKSSIVWYATGSQGQDLLKSGEVTMGQEYANRVTSLRDAGSPVDISWDGQVVAGDLLGVPKGDPNAKAAMKFIAFVTSKDVNGTFSYCAAGAPSNVKSTPNPKIANDLPTAHLGQTHVVETSEALSEYVAGHLDAIQTAFSNWRSS